MRSCYQDIHMRTSVQESASYEIIVISTLVANYVVCLAFTAKEAELGALSNA